MEDLQHEAREDPHPQSSAAPGMQETMGHEGQSDEQHHQPETSKEAHSQPSALQEMAMMPMQEMALHQQPDGGHIEQHQHDASEELNPRPSAAVGNEEIASLLEKGDLSPTTRLRIHESISIRIAEEQQRILIHDQPAAHPPIPSKLPVQPPHDKGAKNHKECGQPLCGPFHRKDMSTATSRRWICICPSCKQSFENGRHERDHATKKWVPCSPA